MRIVRDIQASQPLSVLLMRNLESDIGKKIVALATALVLSSLTQAALALTPEEDNRIEALIADGTRLLGENKPEEAIVKYRKAREVSPPSCVILVNLGLALARVGKYDEALVVLNEAVKLDPNFRSAWLNLGSVYLATGRISRAIEIREEQLRRFPKDRMASNIREDISSLKKAMSFSAICGDAVDHPDYFPSVVYKGVKKWDSQRFPLKVFITRGDPKQNYRDSFSKQIEHALNLWQSKSNNVVSFVLVDKPSIADIVVKWTADKKDAPYEEGDCHSVNKGATLHHATVTLFIGERDEGLPLCDELVHSVGLHELGHAIGLMGHSINSNDIMYGHQTFDINRHTVSARDTATLLHLYQPEIRAALPSEIFEEAITEFNNEIDKPVAVRNFAPVISKLEKIKKDFPDIEEVKPPLVAAYIGQGKRLLREGKAKEAADFLGKALSNCTKQNQPAYVAALRQDYARVLKYLHRDAEAVTVLSGKKP